MVNRKRDIQKFFRVNEEEDKMIKEKMKQLGTDNFGAYARKMLIDGYVVKTDYTTIKNLIKEINKIGVDRKSTRLNSSHPLSSRMPSSA